MGFTLRQLRYFIAVAENGSVSGAAQVLSVSQSAVTEAVKDLEYDLGVTLFDRHRRGLSLTYKGQQFQRHASKVLNAAADARQSFAAESQAEPGTINFGVTSLVAGYVLSDILARYRRAFPHVQTRALEDNGEYLEHLLIGGELDVAVMVISNLRDRVALQSQIFERSRYRLWMPSGHPLAEEGVVDARRIGREPLIMLTVDEIEENTARLLSTLGAKPNVAFRTRSVEAVRSLVATGAGLALLPDLVYRRWSLEGDRIECREVSGDLPMVEVGLVWRRGSSPARAVQDFIAMAGTGSGRTKPV